MNTNLKSEAEKCSIPYEKKGRVLVWHDEFDKGEINKDNWCFIRSMNARDRIYDDSEKCCRIEGDKLLLQTHRTDDPEHPIRLSEGFSTAHRMLFKYGYVEMRAKIPYHHGSWPSFWTQSSTVFSTVPWFSEFDIFEVFSDPNHLKSCVHKWGNGKHCAVSGGDFDSGSAYKFHNWEDVSEEYHLYAMEWDDKFIVFSVDGDEFCRIPIDNEKGNFGKSQIDGVEGLHDFSYLIMNNEVFTARGGWVVPGWTITDKDKLPFNYYIDYVRLYQKQGEEIKFKDEILAAEQAKKEN